MHHLLIVTSWISKLLACVHVYAKDTLYREGGVSSGKVSSKILKSSLVPRLPPSLEVWLGSERVARDCQGKATLT